MIRKPCFVTMGQIIILVLMLLTLIGYTMCATNNLQKSYTKTITEVTASTDRVRYIIENGLLDSDDNMTSSKDISHTADSRRLSMQIAHCRADLDNHKISFNEELDSELNKVNIWITFVVLIFGIMNILFTVGNNFLASSVISDMETRYDKLVKEINKKSNDLRTELINSKEEIDTKINTVITEIECIWSMSGFTMDAIIKEYRHNRDTSTLRNLLRIIKERIGSMTNEQNHGKHFLQSVRYQLFNDDLSLTAPQNIKWIEKIEVIQNTLDGCIASLDNEYIKKLSELDVQLGEFIDILRSTKDGSSE